MNIRISNTSLMPLYEQIYTQIKHMILSGELKAGDALPTIRSLAQDLRISVITTSRAYADLERGGFIYTVVGKGSFVAEINGALIREENLKKMEESIGEALAYAKQAGLTNEQFLEIIRVYLGSEI